MKVENKRGFINRGFTILAEKCYTYIGEIYMKIKKYNIIYIILLIIIYFYIIYIKSEIMQKNLVKINFS